MTARLRQSRSVVFRCDGSSSIGLGHVMRSLTVASGLRQAGADPITFVTRDLDPVVTARIQQAGFEYRLLREGIAEEEDRSVTMQVCREGKRLLVTDSHDFSPGYYEAMHEADIPTVSFDDYAGVAYASDVVINHNITAGEFSYRVAAHTKLLLGPAYFPLREPFQKFAGRERAIRSRVESIVVCLGGMPEPAAAMTVLQGLRPWVEKVRARVTMVMGVQVDASYLRIVEPHLPSTGSLVADPQDLASLLWEADLAIVNGSVTAYEAAAIGTPLIMTAIAGNQVDAVLGFGTAETAVALPPVTTVRPAAITKSVAALAGDDARRRKLSEAGRAMVDGRGLERIVKMMATLTASEMASVGKGASHGRPAN